ncbi:hypothetical protein FRC09_020193 [Ceratobasidium sp. 395]|nr:hypothetical protein FRC09_020193 [Ceratobasidium sp. 395]
METSHSRVLVCGSMGPSLTFTPELPADDYVQLARTCKELKVETSPGSSPTAVRAKRCCFCFRVVKLGSGSADYSLQQHMRSYDCRKAQSNLVGCGSTRFSSELQQLDVKPAASDSQRFTDWQLLSWAHRATLTTQHTQLDLLLDTCPGARVDCEASMFSHYPWHLHDTQILDYELSYIDPKGHFFRVRSRECKQKVPTTNVACEACNQIVLGRQLQELMKRANLESLVAQSLNVQYRTHWQLSELLRAKILQINELLLKSFVDLKADRRIQSLSGRMDNQKRLMFAIAQSDDIAVGRIVQTALQNGAGIETMIDRIIQAQQGLFSPHNYSQKAFNLIALVLKIGGPRLAFAVAKAMHLPSISTISTATINAACETSRAYSSLGSSLSKVDPAPWFPFSEPTPAGDSRLGNRPGSAYHTPAGFMRKPQLAQNASFSCSKRIPAPIFEKGFHPSPDLKVLPDPDSDSSDHCMNTGEPNHKGDMNFDEESTSSHNENDASSLSPPHKRKVQLLLQCATGGDDEDGGVGQARAVCLLNTPFSRL